MSASSEIMTTLVFVCTTAYDPECVKTQNLFTVINAAFLPTSMNGLGNQTQLLSLLCDDAFLENTSLESL